MPVNEFEQQVQQKLEELQLQPSGEVWEEVEKRIQKEKKRRRVIFWWLFPLLLLGGGAAVYIYNDKQEELTITEQTLNPQTTENSDSDKSKKNNINNNELNNNTTSTDKENNPPAPEQTTGINEEKIGTAGKETMPVPVQSSAITVKAAGISKKKNTGIKTSSNRNSEESMLTTIVSAGKQKKGQPVNEKTEIVDNIPGATEEIKIQPVTDELKPLVTSGNDIVTADDKKDTAAQVLAEVKKEPEAELVPATGQAKKPTGKNNKWEFGVHAAAGASGVSEGISFFDAQKSADALSSPGGQFNMAGPLSPVTAAAPQNSFYWQAGVYAKRKLSRKTAVSAGLDFSAYTTVRATGVFIETSRMVNNGLSNFTVADYYYSGTSYSYKNRYYFLQVPVSFHWQFNKGRKLPLEWQNGLSAGWMTNTNALVYSPASNVFFKDNSSFNKFQLAYQSGISARFFNTAKHPLTAGFVFNYHLSKLEKVKSTDGNHLASFGLRLGWVLKK
jgi:hypothetical protein